MSRECVSLLKVVSSPLYAAIVRKLFKEARVDDSFVMDSLHATAVKFPEDIFTVS